MRNLGDRTGAGLIGVMRCAIAAFALLSAVASGAGMANTADVRPFHLTDFDGFVELGFLTALEDRSRTTSADSGFDRVEFSQLLNLSSGAYVYHPSFLTLHGGFQVEFIEDVMNLDNNRTLLGGDWRFNLLQNHPDRLSVFGRVLETESARPFSEPYQVLSQLYGATIFERRGWLPFHVTYQHRSISTSEAGGFDDTADEILFSGNYHAGEWSRGDIHYDLIFQDLSGDDVRRQEVSLNNISQFGDERQHRWYTNFLFNEQIIERGFGTDERYTAGGSTNFTWRHTDDLWTEYLLSGRWSEFGDQTVTNLNPTVSITHKLYESLTTYLEIFGRLQGGSIGSMNQFGGVINETYTKEISDWGRLAVRASPRIVMTYDRPEQDAALAEESFLLPVNSDAARQLAHRDIIGSPIVSHPKCPGGTCTEGVDYVLVDDLDPDIAEGFVGLKLPFPLGINGLDATDEVLVSYTYDLGGRADHLTTSVDVEANLWILDHLGLFSQYETRNQKLLSGDERDFRINEYDRSAVGLQLKWPWFSARAQFENYDATFSSFRGYTVSASVFSGVAAAWRARLNAGYALRDHTDTGETLDRLTMSGSVRRHLFRRGELELEGRYRRERWSGVRSGDDTDTLFVDAGYTWWYGKINVKLKAGVAQIFRETEDRSVYRVDLRVRRSF